MPAALLLIQQGGGVDGAGPAVLFGDGDKAFLDFEPGHFAERTPTEPTGGFLTWLTLPEELDTLAMRPAATAAGVAYVPGPPFHVDGSGRNTLRLSFSHLTETELETAVDRLAAVVRGALERPGASSRAQPR